MGPCRWSQKIAHGWKGDRPWVRLETEQMLARSPKITSGQRRVVIRWLHHCTFRSEKQVRACCRFMKARFNVHSQFLASTGNPLLDVTKAQIQQRVRQLSVQDHSGKRRGTNARSSKIRDPETRIQSGSCRLFVSCRDNLILKQWKLGILEQVMNSPDETKLYFTKNWQIENKHFVILVLEVFKSWKNWRESRNFDSKNFRKESWSKIIFEDVESVRSGQILHVPSQPASFPLPREPGGLLSRY